MKIKTSELSDAALDWAVAIAADRDAYIEQGHKPCVMAWTRCALTGEREHSEVFEPHRDAAQALPLLEAARIGVVPHDEVGRTESGQDYQEPHRWKAYRPKAYWQQVPTIHGRTLLEVGCRCYVQYHLGDEVDVPDELLETTK